MSKILCIGDSNTYGYDPRAFGGGRYPEGIRWTSLLEGAEVINRGLNGMKVPADAARFTAIIRIEDPDLVIIMLGTNDILSGRGAEQTAQAMEKIIAQIKDEGKPILIISPPQICLGEWVPGEEYLEEAEELAVLYRDIARKHDCPFADAGEWDIDLCYDGVHLSEEGHLTFAQRLQEVLNSLV